MTLLNPRWPHRDLGEGGPDTFRAFYESTAVQVLRAVCRMTAGDRPAAEDALQDAYVVMFLSWSVRAGRTREENRKYLVGIAAHKVTDAYRRRGMLVELDEEREPDAVDDDLAAMLDERAALAAARDLMERQPPRRRIVVAMHFLEDMEYADIARALGITESTVRTQVERFCKLLTPLTDRFSTTQGGELS
ncbi:RNA polymerase sigma factor [Lentzea sp. NPDC054927]